jgi:NAD(P)-dependent dehydrogenase (short-subunit alcohol dehydrogenase family)
MSSSLPEENLSKVWFDTGAGRGIGSDLVTAALNAGHKVVATARDAASITDEVGNHENLLPLAMDVTNPTEIDTAVEAALKRFGRIDVLINNAGRFYTGFFETMTPEQVRAQMEVNFLGTLDITRAVLPTMRKQRQGHIVTLSALVGVVGAPFISIYSASKFALEGWMESLAPEVAPFGISTTIVEPGAFRTKPPRDRARSVFPDCKIDDYADETVKRTTSVKAFNGLEPGDRHKFADAFISVANMNPPPMRWVAGKDAVEGITAKGQQLITDAARFFELSTSLDHLGR